MLQEQNPFVTGAVQHGQMVLNESNRAVSNSQALLAVCNEIINAAQAGNVQGALAAAHNARNLAGQLNSSAQTLQYALASHFERIAYGIGRIQARVNTAAAAIENARARGSAAPPYAAGPSWQAAGPWQFQAGWHMHPGTPIM